MDQIDTAVQHILSAYEARSAEETRRWLDLEWKDFVEARDEFLLAVGPATGQLINLLVKESGARSILEVGTSYGYSTVWLAEAARATGGRVTTLELQPGKQEYARQKLTEAGLVEFVEFKLGDARQSIAQLQTHVDFVLLDLWKDLYIPCFDLFHSKLSPGALVVADNMLFPESARPHATLYRQHVRSKSDIESILLKVGSGLELSRRKSDDD